MSRPARLSISLTFTRPASQVSFARVRRRMTRLHLRNKSSRIARASIGFGGARVGVTFFDLDETVRTQFGQIIPDLWPCLLVEQLVINFSLSAFERKNATRMSIVDFQNHKAGIRLDDVGRLAFFK